MNEKQNNPVKSASLSVWNFSFLYKALYKIQLKNKGNPAYIKINKSIAFLCKYIIYFPFLPAAPAFLPVKHRHAEKYF